jgi:hypothetical protein
MLIEYVAFGALVVIVLMFAAKRPRRADTRSGGDSTNPFPYGDGGAASTDSGQHAAHSHFSGSSSHSDAGSHGGSHGGFDGGGAGSHGGGGFDGGGGSDGGGGFDGGGGHH